MTEIQFEYNILTTENCGPIILYITSPDMKDMSGKILDQIREKTDKSFDLYELVVPNWDRFLTPWAVEAGLKGRTFTGEATETLKWIEDVIIPKISSKFSGLRPVYIAGYSLAGLFSLWVLYNSNNLSGAISCSGSLWYPGWMEFVKEQNILHNYDSKKIVYLSLGKKETKTKHPLMCKVGENTEFLYTYLKESKSIKDVTFQWHEGGHFTDVENRIAQGIVAVLLK